MPAFLCLYLALLKSELLTARCKDDAANEFARAISATSLSVLNISLRVGEFARLSVHDALLIMHVLLSRRAAPIHVHVVSVPSSPVGELRLEVPCTQHV